jgi:hypothetical protein
MTTVTGLMMALMLAVGPAAALAEASHEGWPEIGHHHGHPNNESGTMQG